MTNDISPLNNLTSLTVLQLAGNGISDIDSLSNMNGLTFLMLSDNEISDIGPLVDNLGLDDGDHVRMWYNSLECDKEDLNDISILEDRGVELDHDC